MRICGGNGDAETLALKIFQAQARIFQGEARLGSGTIESSLFAAADESRLPDSVTVQLAELFSTDIDFRRELKRSVHDEILRHKLQRSFELLSGTSLGICEVAQAAGFRSVQYLNAVFKRELGATPAAWRQGHRGGSGGGVGAG